MAEKAAFFDIGDYDSLAREPGKFLRHCIDMGYMLATENIDRADPQGYVRPRKLHTIKRRISKGSFLQAIEYAHDFDKIKFVGQHTLTSVSNDLLSKLNADLRDDTSMIRKLSAWPIKRTFVYLDISEFTKFKNMQQALVINAIIKLVDNKKNWLWDVNGAIEAKLCIGDGYIFVLRDSFEACMFASGLARLIEIQNAVHAFPALDGVHFRMSVHVDYVYCFWDSGRMGFNYIGPGINGGQRVLATIKEMDDVIYISSQVKEELDALVANQLTNPPRHWDVLLSILGTLQNKGRHTDKHHDRWRVYQMNHNVASLDTVLGDRLDAYTH